MNKPHLICSMFALCISISPGINAAPVAYDFIQNGYEDGAFVTGTFLGEDLDSNGQLSSANQGEVTILTMSFSGNNLVGSFSLGTTEPDFFGGLVYDLDGGPLGDGLNGSIEGIGVESGGYLYMTGQGPSGMDGGVISYDEFSSSTSTDELVQVSLSTVVPVPAAVWLFGSGLLGLAGMARCKKTKL